MADAKRDDSLSSGVPVGATGTASATLTQANPSENSDTDEDVFSDLDEVQYMSTAAETRVQWRRNVRIMGGIHREGSADISRDLYGNFRAIRRRFDSTRQFLVFDMRGKGNCLTGSTMVLPGDTESNAIALSMSPDHITELPHPVDNMRILLLSVKQNDKYFFVKTSFQMFCVRQSGTVIGGLFQPTPGYDRRFSALLPLFKSHFDAFGDDEEDMYFFCNKRVVNASNIHEIPNCAVVTCVRSVTVLWRIHHRYMFSCARVYGVKCKIVDTLNRIKHKFLNLYNTADKTEGLESDFIWLTQYDKVITKRMVKQTAGIISRCRELSEAVLQSEHQSSPLRMTIDRDSGMLCVDNVYVHIQPQDAVSAVVTVKSHISQKGREARTVVVVPPQISPNELRENVSKAVGREVNTIQISVGSTELHADMNLNKALSAPGCTLHVTPAKKLSLTVRALCIPTLGADDNQTGTTVVVSAYSNDVVKAVTNDLLRLTRSGQFSVDLYFKGRLLPEDTILSDLRLRDKDDLEAHIFPKRLQLSVRIPGKGWCHVLVDDCFTATIGHLKSFAQSIEGVTALHVSDLTAIVNNRVAFDGEILGDMVAGQNPAPRVVLVLAENTCFTAASACGDGTFVVLSSTEEGLFQEWPAMFNGKKAFYDLTIAPPSGHLASYLQIRRSNPTDPKPVSGIKLLGWQNKTLSPQRSTRQPIPPPRGWSCPALPSQSYAKKEKPAAPEKHQGNSELEASSTRKVPEDPPAVHGKVRRPSSVRFHGGNSSEKLRSQLDAEKTCVVDRNLKLKANTTGAGEEEEEDIKDNDDEKEEETKDDDEEEGVQKKARQRTRSDDTEATVSRGEDSSHVPDKITRSKSCPPIPAVPEADNQVAANSDGETPTSGRRFKRMTTFSEDYVENPDGTWCMNTFAKTQACVTPEFVQMGLSSSPLTVCGFVGMFGGGTQSPPALTQYQDQQSQTMPMQDTAYRYIEEKLVRNVACRLGTNGMMVMRELGVTQDTIDKAMHKHPGELTEQHLYCLRVWCMKAGCHANPEVLKKALIEWERGDLAEFIGNFDPKPPEQSQGASTDSL